MTDDKNKAQEKTNNNTQENKRRPLPQGNIIGKHPEIFNITYKNMYKDYDSSN